MKIESTLEFFLNQLKEKNMGELELVEYLYSYVRDEIKFDFLPGIDDVTAGEVFTIGRGQCNNKTILFYEMLNYFNFNVRARFSTIDKFIQRGFFPRLMMWIAPDEIGHSWIEVELNGKWIQLDGYINDQLLFKGAMIMNKKRNWKTGHSVADSECGASTDFSMNNDKFVQMEAVKTDFGATRDVMTYVRSSKNPNKVNPMKKLAYLCLLPIIRRRVVQIRELARD
ncbi:hypothetical protein A9Q84_14930 [Halobacteriovorax marinus]|uniref:Transglutaminase-like domain-containing protein n=1 Tax=Halobacteriovorax marinus TaxID=97084 RepID=A0A1Y5FAL6_9BACT|nr:hypothetical protein A9Q84_14930 [Halobacteriovorax marinus]